jgi:hypothetical protein
MLIIDEKRGENWAIVIVEIDVEIFYELGKVDISPRWRAAGKSLANKCSIDMPLAQIDASCRDGDIWSGRSQNFIFYFGKVTENVKEDESKCEEEVGQGIKK